MKGARGVRGVRPIPRRYLNFSVTFFIMPDTDGGESGYKAVIAKNVYFEPDKYSGITGGRRGENSLLIIDGVNSEFYDTAGERVLYLSYKEYFALEDKKGFFTVNEDRDIFILGEAEPADINSINDVKSRYEWFAVIAVDLKYDPTNGKLRHIEVTGGK